MALSPDQISAIASTRGDSVVNPQASQPAGVAPSGAAAAYASRVGYKPGGGGGIDPGKIVGDIGQSFNERAANVENIKGMDESMPEKLFQTGGQAAGLLTDTAVDVAKNVVKPEVKDKIKGAISAVANTPVAQTLAKAWGGFKAEHPELAANIEATGNIATILPLFEGAGAIAKGTEAATDAIKGSETLANATTKATEVANTVKNTVKNATTKVTGGSSTAGKVEETVKAVNPDLSGTKGVNAYKQVVTTAGKETPRTATKAGWVSEQTLSPSEQATKVGTRLHDAGIQLSATDHVANLDTLASAMQDTEGKIDTLLKSEDPEVVFNADKQTLNDTLEHIRTTAPRETMAIKDSKKAFNDVVDFAQQLLAKSPDDVKGIRTMRQEFDYQARKEYPNAFKDGVVDTKSPAGQAIKQVRDSINEHLYNTAPKGSEIQRLIQQEADIYRATDSIAPKAFATHGSTKMTQLVSYLKAHPYISIFAGYEAAKHTVAPVLPGF